MALTFNDVLTALQDSAIAHAVSKSNHLIGAGLQIVHIVGFILLLSAIMLISLRVLNLALANYSLAEITDNAKKLIAIGLPLVVISGVLMFIATPRLYVSKWAFNWKMALFAAAIVLHITLFRKAAKAGFKNPLFAKASVFVSLLLWFSVSFAGRIIGFI